MLYTYRPELSSIEQFRSRYLRSFNDERELKLDDERELKLDDERELKLDDERELEFSDWHRAECRNDREPAEWPLGLAGFGPKTRAE